MAEVTGFTADRMRVIENTTVVDGEVQGDNLILLTREGTPIDAGSVRGPQGDQGIPGEVSGVNDQIGSVYAPRIFDTKAALDAGWPTAPIGAMAVTKDSETVWEKVASGWIVTNLVRSFASNADFNARWPGAPEGSRAWLRDSDTMVVCTGPGAWFHENGIRVFADVAGRDTYYTNPTEGSVCEAPVGTFWVRTNGAWYKRGQQIHFAYQDFFGNVNGGGLDLPFTIPVAPVACVVKVSAFIYAGYAPQTGNYVASIYTNSHQAPNGAAFQVYTGWRSGIAGATWVNLGVLDLSFPAAGGSQPLATVRVECSGGVTGFYVGGHGTIEFFAR